MTRTTSRTRRFATTTAVAFAAVLAIGASAVIAKLDFGFGVERDQDLAKNSEQLFGVGKPIAESRLRRSLRPRHRLTRPNSSLSPRN